MTYAEDASSSGFPPGLSLDTSTGAISGTYTSDVCPGTTYDVVIKAVDSCGTPQNSPLFTIHYTVANTAPAPVTAETVSYFVGDVITTVDLQTKFTDTENDDLTITLSTGTLPTGITRTLDTLDGTIDLDVCTEDIVVTYTANDGCADSASYDLTFSITNEAPTAEAEGTEDLLAGSTGVEIALDEFFDDEKGAEALTYTEISSTLSNIGLTYTAGTNMITGDLTEDCGEVSVTVRANDGCTDSENDLVFTITIEKPTVDEGIENKEYREKDAIEFQIPENAFTVADGLTLTYTATLSNEDPLPDWIELSEDGLFSGEASEIGEFEIKVTAENDCGMTVSTTFTITTDKSDPSSFTNISLWMAMVVALISLTFTF